MNYGIPSFFWDDDFKAPWLMSKGGRWIGDTWRNTVEDAIRYGELAKEFGANLLKTEEEHEARLKADALAEAQQPWVDYGDIDSPVGSQADTAGKEAEMARQARMLGLDYDMVPGIGFMPSSSGESKKDDDEDMNLMEQAFLMSMMESMRGEDIGQAPAVVAGGGQRQWPSMMGQFRPWEQQKPYWWIA